MFLQFFPSGWTNALKKVECLPSNPPWIWVLFWFQSICLPLEFVAVQRKGSWCIFSFKCSSLWGLISAFPTSLNLLEHQSQIVKLTEPAELRITQLSFISRLRLLLWSSKREWDLTRLEQILYIWSLCFFFFPDFLKCFWYFSPFLSRHFFPK